MDVVNYKSAVAVEIAGFGVDSSDIDSYYFVPRQPFPEKPPPIPLFVRASNIQSYINNRLKLLRISWFFSVNHIK